MTRPASIARRLSWCLSLQIAIGLGVLCVLVYFSIAAKLADAQAQALESKRIVMEALLVSVAKGGETHIRRKLQELAPARSGTHLELRASDGRLIYADRPAANESYRPEATAVFDIPDEQMPGSAMRASFGIDIGPDERLLATIATILIVATVAGAALAGMASCWQVRRGLEPIEELARQTRGISAKRLDHRLALREPVAELTPMIEQFNALMLRLEEAYERLEGFNADVAHELRTPLSVLIGNSEVVLSRERSVEELRDLLASNLEELDRLSGIVNDMLFLSQSDRGAAARAKRIASLATLARQVAEFHEVLFEEKGLRIEISGDAEAAADAPLIQRAISNLLGNAARFADPGSIVRIRIDDRGVDAAAARRVALMVENDGSPIDSEAMPRLFDRFYRGDAAREDSRQHHGLGLAIVAAIAKMHGGRPIASSANDATLIGFDLPR